MRLKMFIQTRNQSWIINNLFESIIISSTNLHYKRINFTDKHKFTLDGSEVERWPRARLSQMPGLLRLSHRDSTSYFDP